MHNSKIKAISFNVDDLIEGHMYEYACEMKKNKKSFSGLMKNLLLGYLINTGNPPPGIQASQGIQSPSLPPETVPKAEEVVPKGNAPEIAVPVVVVESAPHQDRRGIRNSMPFSLHDDD